MSKIDYAAFRREVEDFVRSACPAEIREVVRNEKKLGRKQWQPWQAILHARGWGAPTWPVEYGGTGWDPKQRHIFDAVLAENDCPPPHHQGLRHIGPVLMEFGTPEQKARFLPRIISGEDFWCQGYSEPGSGSDLASLKTKAVLDGDHYVVNGQKIWTTLAHEADWMFALVRTSQEPKRQDGITMLLIPMDTPGIRVSPIRSIDGWHHLNEVFFDDVRVPVVNRVGEEGRAWRYGKYLLDRERLGPVQNLPGAFRLLEKARALLNEELDEAEGEKRRALQLRLLLVEAELIGLREMGLQAIDNLMNKRPLGVTPSLLKLGWSEATQRVIETAFDAAGARLAPRFLPVEGSGANAEEAGVEWMHNMMYFRARTIYAGTTEVQKNLIARELFGS